MWDPDDYDREKVEKILCWALLIIFGFIGIIQIFPFILYIIIFLGITIPVYFLIKKRNEK